MPTTKISQVEILMIEQMFSFIKTIKLVWWCMLLIQAQTKAGGSLWFLSQVDLHSRFQNSQDIKRTCLKKKINKRKKKKIIYIYTLELRAEQIYNPYACFWRPFLKLKLKCTTIKWLLKLTCLDRLNVLCSIYFWSNFATERKGLHLSKFPLSNNY